LWITSKIFTKSKKVRKMGESEKRAPKVKKDINFSQKASIQGKKGTKGETNEAESRYGKSWIVW